MSGETVKVMARVVFSWGNDTDSAVEQLRAERAIRFTACRTT
jgi:hypothetical protein